MSRSGYDDDCENLAMWRGQVASAIHGKRGQAFLRELATVLDAMPEKRLIVDDLYNDGEVCTLGAVGVARGIDLVNLDPEDHDTLAGVFGIARQLVMEIEWENDEGNYKRETPEERWLRMRKWTERHINPAPQK